MGRSHIGVALGAATLSVVFTLWRPSILADADLRVYDALVQSDGADSDRSVHSAIVAIDEASLERLGQWPWHRDVLARLVDRLQGALVDAYDALVADRAYREGVSHEAAIMAIQAGRGQHFDPDVVDAFLSVHEQFR